MPGWSLKRERLSLDRPLVADLNALSRCGDQINEMHRLIAENIREAEENKARFEKKQRQLAERRARLEARLTDIGWQQQKLRHTFRRRLDELCDQDVFEGEFMEEGV